jgi:HAE1 family hydrophobic/amphiphilic exporter-1
LFIKRPIASSILVIAILIFGGLSLTRLSVDLLPDATQPSLLVSVVYPGAPASEVELRINESLDAILSSVRGVDEVYSIARQGQSLIYLSFGWGTNMDLAFLDVREKLDQARFLLPEEAERPQLLYSAATNDVLATIALRLRNYPEPDFQQKLELKRWAEQVFSRRLEQQEGIAQAILVGAIQPEVHIRFNSDLLARYHISLADLQRSVRQSNLFSATGELRDGWYRYALKIENRIQNLEDIYDIPVTSLSNGRVLRLSELADIEIKEADPTSFALLDNQEILTLQVKKEYGANTVSVFETLSGVIEEVKNEHPEFDIEILREDATFIENSISNLIQALLYGGILAFFVLFLFLNDNRSPFTIGISIPVSIFLTFTVMFLLDIQLNVISLSGLTIGIGLLLDNSIVVLENIHRFRKQGLNIHNAAIKGTREIALPVTASTFTTISVFLPLLFLGGFEGAFFRDLAATLSISLMASLLVALILLPVFIVRLRRNKESRNLTSESRFLQFVIRKYEESISKVINRPFLVMLGASVLIFGALALLIVIPKQALPEAEPKEVKAMVNLGGNASLRSSKTAAIAINEYIREYTDLDGILVTGGFTEDISADALLNEGLNKFKVSVPVNSRMEQKQVERVINVMDSTYQYWNFMETSENLFASFSSFSTEPIEIQIPGRDRSLSKRIAAELEKVLSVQFPDLELSEKFPQRVRIYRIEFDREQLISLDMDENEIIRYLESLSRGNWVTDWNRQDEQISIRLMGDSEDIYNPADILLNLSDKIIPLGDLAEIRLADEYEQLERVAQTAILSYNTNLSFFDWWWNGEKIRQSIGEFTRQTGYEIQLGGTAPLLVDLLKELGSLLLMSVLLIYLILAIQYENLLYPLIIVSAIPFAWVGSIFILYVTGFSLNALSFMGILVLTGIAVNDSILKVDFMRRYYEDSGDLEEAILQAGIHRFRPVVMTSLTTILGLIPMILPLGDGYILRQSLAIALMGGLISSTLLTLYLIPTVFRVIHSFNK